MGMPPRDEARDRARVLELLREHGWNTTSFQVLEAGIRYWFDRSGCACVAYVDTGHAWVAAGAPIAAADALEDACQEFVLAATAARRRVCFFALEDRLVSRQALASMPVGVQPSWVPERWPEKLRASRSLREQLRRARAKEVSVRLVSASEILDPTLGVVAAMEGLVSSWLGSRRMAPLGFLVDVQPFAFPEERRYFLAELRGRLVGFLVAVPIFARQGWFFEDLIRERDAPNGTSELLFDAAIRQVAAEGGQRVTLGLAPLAGDVAPWLSAVRAWFRGLYDFDGLRRFKARLRPDAWETVHLAWPHGRSGLIALHDALSAFTMRGGVAKASFVRFGLETALASPGFAVVVLAALLVPWTILLACTGDGWFPEPWVRLAWVLFDAGLVVGLLSLARRWRRWLAQGLAISITMDALVTITEVALFNLPRVTDPRVYVPLAVACVAPAGAAFFLWLTLRRSRVA